MDWVVWEGPCDEDHCEWTAGNHVFDFVEAVYGPVRWVSLFGGAFSWLTRHYSIDGMRRRTRSVELRSCYLRYT